MLTKHARFSNLLVNQTARMVGYRVPDDHLKGLGLNMGTIVRNPSVSELYEYALNADNKTSVDPTIMETTLNSTGALVNFSGTQTGRSPKDKRTVMCEKSKPKVWWGSVNMPFPRESFLLNKQRAIDYLNSKTNIFVVDGWGSWDQRYQMNVRIVCNRPYHAIFMKTMLIRPTAAQIEEAFADGPDVTIINGGEFYADPQVEGVDTRTCPAVDYEAGEMAILGTHYAGEMKKGFFGIMHYLMPDLGVLSMHAAANEGPDGDTTLLFGLSGTGKTTLSADPKRSLLGDDEHCWTDHGIFNIEGGCYAKAIDLSEEAEPEIFRAIKYGAILENIEFKDDEPNEVDYHKVNITENTRAAYPLEHIPGVKIPAVGGHPKNVIFLTCDASGVLPPVSKLTSEQSMYHFISGYTAKVAGTEVGITEPVPAFSACFGEAFLPRHPFIYAEMLAEKCKKHGADVWLLNSGWTGGMYGEGHRMSLKATRTIIDGIHKDGLKDSKFSTLPVFNLSVPDKVPGISDNTLFNPRNTWKDKAAYDTKINELATAFQANMEKYTDMVPKDVVKKGGPSV